MHQALNHLDWHSLRTGLQLDEIGINSLRRLDLDLRRVVGFQLVLISRVERYLFHCYLSRWC